MGPRTRPRRRVYPGFHSTSRRDHATRFGFRGGNWTPNPARERHRHSRERTTCVAASCPMHLGSEVPLALHVGAGKAVAAISRCSTSVIARAAHICTMHLSKLRGATCFPTIHNQATPDRQEPGHTDDGLRTRAHRASNGTGTGSHTSLTAQTTNPQPNCFPPWRAGATPASM